VIYSELYVIYLFLFFLFAS